MKTREQRTHDAAINLVAGIIVILLIAVVSIFIYAGVVEFNYEPPTPDVYSPCE